MRMLHLMTERDLYELGPKGKKAAPAAPAQPADQAPQAAPAQPAVPKAKKAANKPGPTIPGQEPLAGKEEPPKPGPTIPGQEPLGGKDEVDQIKANNAKLNPTAPSTTAPAAPSATPAADATPAATEKPSILTSLNKKAQNPTATTPSNTAPSPVAPDNEVDQIKANNAKLNPPASGKVEPTMGGETPATPASGKVEPTMGGETPATPASGKVDKGFGFNTETGEPYNSAEERTAGEQANREARARATTPAADTTPGADAAKPDFSQGNYNTGDITSKAQPGKNVQSNIPNTSAIPSNAKFPGGLRTSTPGQPQQSAANPKAQKSNVPYDQSPEWQKIKQVGGTASNLAGDVGRGLGNVATGVGNLTVGAGHLANRIGTGLGSAIQGVGNVASQAAGGIGQTLGAAAGGLGRGYHMARQGRQFKASGYDRPDYEPFSGSRDNYNAPPESNQSSHEPASLRQQHAPQQQASQQQAQQQPSYAPRQGNQPHSGDEIADLRARLDSLEQLVRSKP